MIDHRFNDCKKFFGALAARYRGNFQDDFKVSNALSEQFVAPFRYLQTTPIDSYDKTIVRRFCRTSSLLGCISPLGIAS